MTIVTNIGPLIALAKVDQLALLPQLFGDVYTPLAVQRELLAKRGLEVDRLIVALDEFITVETAPELRPEVRIVTSDLDVGEREAIALAYESRKILLIDERLGRMAARRLNLSVTGTVGVLITAKQAGLVPSVTPLLEEMRQQGYWLSNKLIEIASRLSGEADSRS